MIEERQHDSGGVARYESLHGATPSEYSIPAPQKSSGLQSLLERLNLCQPFYASRHHETLLAGVQVQKTN